MTQSQQDSVEQPQWLDELFDKYTRALTRYTDEHGNEITDFDTRIIDVFPLTQEIAAKLQQLMVEARIDELKYWQWKTDGHIELSSKDVDNRLAQLTATKQKGTE